MGNYVDKSGRSALPDEIHDLTDTSDPRNDDNLRQLMKMSVEERNELERTLKSEFHPDKATVAKYKVEVIFSEGRSNREAYPGMSQVYKNPSIEGNKGHGGGDELVYFCRAPHPTKHGEECDAPIESKLINAGKSVCSRCYTVVNPRKLYSERLARLTTQNWAKHLLWRMETVDLNADLVIQYNPGDLRRYAMEMREKHGVAHASDSVDRMRGKYVRAVYPLSSMVRDTSNGAELEARIRAFLEA